MGNRTGTLHRRTVRPAVIAAAVALVSLGALGPVVSASAPAPESLTADALMPVWSANYNSGPDAIDAAVEIAESEGKVFVTGRSFSESGFFDFVTIAYDSATGAQRWLARYDGPSHDLEAASGIAVDEGRVFVTGQSPGQGTFTDYATVAYDAETGAQLWAARYDGPSHFVDNVFDVLAGNGLVYVTGESRNDHAADFHTIAYDGASGAVVWSATYNGPYVPPGTTEPTGGTDVAREMALVDGSLYVAGESHSDVTTNLDHAVVAYDAASGEQLWVGRYAPTSNMDYVTGVAAEGGLVAVTGLGGGVGSSGDYATAIFDATTGALRWAASYNGPGNDKDWAQDVAIAEGKVFVTGRSIPLVNAGGGLFTADDYATVAYEAVTGTQLWVARYDGPTSGYDYAEALDVKGGRVFVTGGSMKGPALNQDVPVGSHDYATVVYDAVSGRQTWLVREPSVGASTAEDVLVVGDRVYVTGGFGDPITNHDFRTIAYAVGIHL